MSVTVDSVIDKVQITLQDTTGVRWPESELVSWVNDAQREIALLKPDASAVNANVTLAEGTLQTIPSDGNRLLKVIRNTDANGKGQRSIRLVKQEVLDSQTPSWHDENVTGEAAHSTEVKHYVYNEENPRNYYVYPGTSSAAVKIDIIYSANPATVITGVPATAWAAGVYTYDAQNDQFVEHNQLKYKLIQTTTADAEDGPGGTDSATHWQLVGRVYLAVPDIYANAVMNYVLYMAYMKDADFAANAQRASTHYQLFNATVMGKSNTDEATSPNQKANSQSPMVGA